MPDQTFFSISREGRDRFCAKKDRVLMPILRKIRIPDPAAFHAIIMPSLYGPEAFFLVKRGVPASNLFAIEDNCAEREGFDVHAEIRNCLKPDRQELKGMLTTGVPEPFEKALDEAYYAFDGRPYDLIYLDFLSQPEYKRHYDRGVLKIMRAGMLAPGSTLILNFGKSRCRSKVAGINRDVMAAAKKSGLRVRGGLPTEVYIGAAIAESGYPPFRRMESHTYLSDVGPRRAFEYTTTVARF